MNFEELMSDYQNDNSRKSREVLKKMGRAKGHPILKRIKTQLIFESILWALLLLVYYSGFDGDQKPVIWNVILVLSILLLLLHDVLGYGLAQSPINGPNLVESLRTYLKKIKRYARISIATRVIAILALLAFFASTFSWTKTKIIASGIFVVFLIFIQIYVLWKVWKARIHKIDYQISSLENDIKRI